MPGPADVLDEALPGLSTALNPGTMSQMLCHLLPGTATDHEAWRVVGVELLKHKPGRRCALAYTFDGPGPRQRLFAKTFRNDRGEGILTKLRAFAQALDGVPEVIVPRPLAYLPELKMLVTEFVEARPLAPRVYDGSSDLAARRMAFAAATLHGSGVRCEKDWGRSQELDNTRRWIGGLRGPAIARAADLLARLREWAVRVPSHAGLATHKDYYPEQVMDAGPAVVLLDMDDASHADPAVDLGNFVAHLKLRRLQFDERTLGCHRARNIFLDEYRKHAPDAVELDSLADRVRFYEATSLLRLAGVYAHRERWAGSLPLPLLDFCEKVLAEGERA